MTKSEENKQKYRGKQKCLRCVIRKRDRKDSVYCEVCRELLSLINLKRSDKK